MFLTSKRINFFVYKLAYINLIKASPRVQKQKNGVHFANSSLFFKKIKKLLFLKKKQNLIVADKTSPLTLKVLIKQSKPSLTCKYFFIYNKFLNSFLKAPQKASFLFHVNLFKLLQEQKNAKEFTKNERRLFKNVLVALKKNSFFLLKKKIELNIRNKAIIILLKSYLKFKSENKKKLYNNLFVSFFRFSKEAPNTQSFYASCNKLKKLKEARADNNIKMFYSKFIGLCTKKGAKSKATNIVTNVMQQVSSATNTSAAFVTKKILNRLKLLLELKTVRKRLRKTKKKAFHLIPYPITKKRKFFLIIKLLTEAMSKKHSKQSSVEKLTQDLTILLIEKKKSPLFNAKQSIVEAALKNRSNKHFRW